MGFEDVKKVDQDAVEKSRQENFRGAFKEAVQRRKEGEKVSPMEVIQEEANAKNEEFEKIKAESKATDEAALAKLREEINGGNKEETGTKSEVQGIYERLKQDEKAADAARSEKGSSWDKAEKDKMYNLVVNDRRQAETLSDSEVQRSAKEHAGITPDEAGKVRADLTKRMESIMQGSPKLTPESQKELDLLRHQKEGVD